MSGKPAVAADTSFVIALMKGSILSDFAVSQVGFPVAVLGELRFGAMNGRNPSQKIAEVEELLRSGTILPADDDTATVYARIRQELRRAGTPLPENDIWIAATSIQHALPLLTLDEHFTRVRGLELRR